MKIVVIGGTGLIGSKAVALLRQGGHEVSAASPKSGVNTITGEGLKEVMAGAQVVIDLANSPSFEDEAVLAFFETSGRNLLAAEAAAGVRHHVALSIVGTDRTADNGYFRAKVAQENLIRASGIPYTIIRATQFLEFLPAIDPVAVADDPELLEDVERPVDSRWDGIGVDRATALDELRAGDVPVGLGQDLDEDAALRRPAQALRPEAIGDARPSAGHGRVRRGHGR